MDNIWRIMGYNEQKGYNEEQGEKEYAIVKISIHFGNSTAFFGMLCFCFRHLLRASLLFFFNFPFISTLQVDISQIMSNSNDKNEHED